MVTRRSLLLGMTALGALSACGAGRESTKSPRADLLNLYPGETPALRAKINHWADHYGVPRSLVHRVVQRESDYNTAARNGPYYGLMQILPQTARGMGFEGEAMALLDADTNLKYGVKYLRGAWMCADGDEQTAVMWYARGYYYEAKRRGILYETGLRT
ncbi:transglycosylase-like protein with SLT domain [Rhodobacter aestuarii]|uniref:Transglycosylase SLT domain-containing protein n=1 Tax=Rhodobacter aestuarii TaxID=453582 RepID=A0A1N7PN61_9RHOB|nr:lytic transglycosylase domain-containing protein [Rhodobacter aestuarii]PTV94291.1 transglycosylase-like protein with SLT domain [Rhodobacter aestuarii]SIT11829.1 Transglycosylase SLT domain-containing protein [Rhodobacter aestuarii]